MNKIIRILIIIFSALLLLLLIRFMTPRELDDISPEIPCSEDLLKESSTLWIIPRFENKSIAENKEWCSYISSLNKTLGLHGIQHTYEEFKTDRSEEYLQEGVDIFEQCFGYKPTLFKPPQLSISKNNKELIRKNDLRLKGYLNEQIHKVYHCNDTGKFSNKFIRIV
jgi:predicted deacetylase